jgi:probable F420-dependent oxidoreductase
MIGIEDLGCYVLPGGVSDPRPAIEQARAAEGFGMATVWLGERYDTKDLPSLAGALSQATHRVKIAAGVTHPGLRHPMVLASMGQTLQALSGGRFVMGVGRSAPWRWKAYGAPAPTLDSMADLARVLRALWDGETVSYSGPLGSFPELRLAQRADVPPPPLLLAAVGPRTVELAGRTFDGLILHPFLTPEGVRRSIEAARMARQRQGADPAGLRCYATVVVACDLDADRQALAVASRAAGYFQVRGLGDALVEANGWDQADLAAYRSQPALVELGDRPADKALGRQQLADLTAAMPGHWLASASATGDTTACTARLAEYLAAGADELILHGSTSTQLASLADALR